MMTQMSLILLYLKDLWDEASESTIPDDDDPSWEHFRRVSMARLKVFGILMAIQVVLVSVLILAFRIGL